MTVITITAKALAEIQKRRLQNHFVGYKPRASTEVKGMFDIVVDNMVFRALVNEYPEDSISVAVEKLLGIWTVN